MRVEVGERFDVRVGCAGWSVPRACAERFAAGGSQLERYASRFSAVEINSSFYRPHRRTTYERWASATPAGFVFSVKLPKEITHKKRLLDAEENLREFASQVAGLGEKFGAILVQLPPSLQFDAGAGGSFLEKLRLFFQVPIVFEARHLSWFDAAASQLLKAFQIVRVIADPPVAPETGAKGASAEMRYYRLHGSPRMYYSTYSSVFLDTLAGELARHARTSAVWCIFDNTALGAATENALELTAKLKTIRTGNREAAKSHRS